MPRTRHLWPLVPLLICLWAAWGTVPQVTAARPSESRLDPRPLLLSGARAHLPVVAYWPDDPDPVVLCRYGVAVWPAYLSQFDIVDNLNVGWYLDFGAHLAPPGPPAVEFAFMVRLAQDRGGSDVCGPDYGYTVTPPLTDDGLGRMVDLNRGALWVVGNEPDRIGQDGVCPQQYAEAYHDVYHFVKSRDPTARVAIAGLVEVTPGRLQYLDIAWDTYATRYGETMPVDVWTMHIYILSETGEGDAHIALGTDPDLAIPFSFDCADPASYCHAEHDDVALFVAQVVQMRTWMAQRGEQEKPLIITEYGILKPYHYPTPENPEGMCAVTDCSGDFSEWQYCFCDENGETFHPQRVVGFMHQTFDYLMSSTDVALGCPQDGYRLVQQWLWYSLATIAPWDLGHASNLMDPGGGYAVTAQGQGWQDYVQILGPMVNLFPVGELRSATYLPPGAGVVDVPLAVGVANNGETTLGRNVTVTFYRDAGLSLPLGSTVIGDLPGCIQRQAVARVTWPGLGVGQHAFWFKIDSSDGVMESDETDNVGTGVVTVYPYGQRLPLVWSAFARP
ncbi:MAG: hypothetical protein JW900_02305 [Anaerolineae bacterium]|nr:hypothetical protein [Anaerolineae bacterium]